MKYDERLNKWKNRMTDLEDQIRMLQHEVNIIHIIKHSLLKSYFQL